MACGYDDEWIIAHKGKYKYWSEMYTDYMAAHPNEEHTCGAFTQRTRKLGLNRHYTPEQDDWLRENYPHMGASEAYQVFCETFGVMKGYQGFKTHITDLGLKVSAQRQYEADQNNGRRENVPIGTIGIRTHKQRNGKIVQDKWIKTGEGTAGWMPLSHYIMGKPQKGQRIIHLDGDNLNDDPDNLAVIDLSMCAMMTGNGFWSDDPHITKTALKWCELKMTINKEDKRRERKHDTKKRKCE